MNRRNFLLGVGTAATLSGAAAITGAALNNTVSTSFGGFEVRVRQEIEVRRNAVLSEQNILSNNQNFSNESINFTRVGQDSPVDYSDFPQLYVNNKTDENLIVEVATGDDTDVPYNNNLSTGGTEPYNSSEPYGYAPLVIENTGSEQKDVAVEFTYGADVTDSNTDLSKGQVAELYRFHIDGTRVSPSKSSPDADGSPVTFSAGQERRVDLNIQLFESTAEDVRSAAGNIGSYSISDNSRARTDVLDAAVFKDVT